MAEESADILKELQLEPSQQHMQEFQELVSTVFSYYRFSEDCDGDDCEHNRLLDTYVEFGKFPGLRGSESVQKAIMELLHRDSNLLFDFLSSSWTEHKNLKKLILSVFHRLREVRGDVNIANDLRQKLTSNLIDEDTVEVFIDIAKESNENYLLSELALKFSKFDAFQKVLAEKIESYDESQLASAKATPFPFYLSNLRSTPISEKLQIAIAKRVSLSKSEEVLLDLLRNPTLASYEPVKQSIVAAIESAKRPWMYIEAVDSAEFSTLPEISSALVSRIDDIGKAIRESKNPIEILHYIAISPKFLQDPVIRSANDEVIEAVKTGFNLLLHDMTEPKKRIYQINRIVGDVLLRIESQWVVDAIGNALENASTSFYIARSVLHACDIFNQKRIGPIALKLLRAIMQNSEGLQRTNEVPRPGDPILVNCIAKLLENPSIVKNADDTVVNLLREFPQSIKDLWDIPRFAEGNILNDTVYWILTSESTTLVDKVEVLQAIRKRKDILAVKQLTQAKRFEEVIESLKALQAKSSLEEGNIDRHYRKILGNILRWDYS